MKRLLCILSNMNAGGAETFLMKIYRQIDRSKYQMDFCINVKERCFYEDEIERLGGIVYRIPSKTEDMSSFRKGLYHVIKDNGYKYVLRITSNAAGFIDLKIAKEAGAEVCAVRSSNSSDGTSWKSRIIHIVSRFLYQKYIDIKIAPSELAAKYTFGNVDNVNYLHNAIDLQVYRFDDAERKRVREEFTYSNDDIVIGHIGRFRTQKNHSFLIDIFEYLYKENKKYKFLLVGIGELEKEIKEKVKRLGLSDAVTFAGERKDIPSILSAMDVFVFPSLYEGMPNTVIEAQATGLPCVIADTITREANITNLVTYLPLKDVEEWTNTINNNIGRPRVDTELLFRENKYDIESQTDEFVRLVFPN